MSTITNARDMPSPFRRDAIPRRGQPTTAIARPQRPKSRTTKRRFRAPTTTLEAMVHATDAAREALREQEALVFDWSRVAICCAAAGEVTLRRDSGQRLAASPSFRRLDGDVPIYAHRMAYPHLAGRDVTIDCRRIIGLRR